MKPGEVRAKFNNSIKEIDQEQEKLEKLKKSFLFFKWKMICLNDLTFQLYCLPSV